MRENIIYTSLTRTSDLKDGNYDIDPLQRDKWSHGDFVIGRITRSSVNIKIELDNGRMMTGMQGDMVIGCLGERYATMEATGSWQDTQEDGVFQLLTGAGLIGVLTSKAPFVPRLVELKYEGHLFREGIPLNLKDFVVPCEYRAYNVPTIIIVGTSMSAGKTASAKVLAKMLKDQGMKVLGAKLTGAGRYRDILSMKDSGAFEILDFVDAGLPSSIVDRETYKIALKNMLCHIALKEPDVAVVEIGASPLEPYNGDLAYNAIKHAIKCNVLCASDPYAVHGVMEAFGIKPDIVAGVATNTLAGRELIEKLCGVPAFNLLDLSQRPDMLEIVLDCLDQKSVESF